MTKNKSKSSLLILFSVIVLDLIGFGVVMPILKFYAEKYGANATELGFLLASYAAMQFIFSPVWGKLSDRIGRKKVLLITISGASVGLLILGLAQSLVMIFVGRILSGIFAANISVASAYVTDVTTVENRAKGMGLIGAAFGIGFVLGPAIGGILSPYGYPVPILFAAGLGVVNLVYAWFRLEESYKAPQKEADLQDIPSLFSQPGLLRFCAINLIFTLGVSQLETVFAFFMTDRFNYDAKHVSYLFVLMALIMVSIQGGMIKRLVETFGEKRLILTGGILLAVSFFLMPSSAAVLILLIPLSVSSVGRGISQPSLLSLVSKSAEDRERGTVMGSFQSSASLARVGGPALAGILYDRAHAYPFYLAGVMMVVMFVISLFLPSQAKNNGMKKNIEGHSIDLQPS